MSKMMISKPKASFKDKKKPIIKIQVLKRLIKMLLKSYPILMPATIVCILLSSLIAASPDIILKKILDVVSKYIKSGNWQAARKEVFPLILILIGICILGITFSVLYSQLMAVITQGFLKKIRIKLFNGMQDLPLIYFDTHKHGDIMSHYTNDVDTIRQLVSQSIPAIVRAGSMTIFVFFVMIYYSCWMTLIPVFGLFLITKVSKFVARGSGKYFVKQQFSIGKMEGFIQEMMNGQKVIKVFNHERLSEKDFDKVNEELFENMKKAHTYANVLMPVVQNIGNIIYVLVAVIGALCIAYKAPNLSLSGSAFKMSIVVIFLNMTKQFTGNASQVSQEINSIVMGMAGAERVFELMDQEPEWDFGTVSLVTCNIDENGNITEADKRTGHWAWKDEKEDGSVKYIELKGDVRFENVDFGYNSDKPVLRDINLYAKPGQKVAFVGATGAGKTTITNLINRYYDVQGGKITYDGIDVNRIRKKDLRKSMGLVLQETNLFTGTVLDNIRYGKLDATKEECIKAAKIAGAHSFIERLADGYDTMLTSNGANFSQGQRQLLSIARAAVNDPPVMILDEATSSIDTHTEKVVQKGMDNLMKGRTTFVIAHRLSTVMDADVIMVLENGRIIERGNHDDLIAEKGVYYQLYTGAFELE